MTSRQAHAARKLMDEEAAAAANAPQADGSGEAQRAKPDAPQAEQHDAGVVPVLVVGDPVQFLPRGPRGWCPALVTAVEGGGRISLVCFRHDFGAAEWHASVPYRSDRAEPYNAEPYNAEPYWRTLADALAEAAAAPA